MAKKWKFELNEQLLREMGREAVAEAAAQAGAAERALTLAHRLVPIIQAALKEGYAPKEIAADHEADLDRHHRAGAACRRGAPLPGHQPGGAIAGLADGAGKCRAARSSETLRKSTWNLARPILIVVYKASLLARPPRGRTS
jgi:hypothetical protein